MRVKQLQVARLFVFEIIDLGSTTSSQTVSILLIFRTIALHAETTQLLPD
jgi:hypothetical protein